MAKIILMFVATIVVCATLCYMTSRVCNTIDSKAGEISKEHEVLMKDHEELHDVLNKTTEICNEIDKQVDNMSIQHDALMDVVNETRITAMDTNEKITFLYNMVRNQNPDLKPTTERNK